MSDIKESIKKLEKAVLEDGKVDRAEAAILLSYASARAGESAEMAEFVKALQGVLEDGVVTPEESIRIGAHLKWLAREAESEEPETTFLGRLFKLKRNRTSVKTEIVAGVTTFMTMAYILAVNPNILSVAGIPRGGVFMATAVAAVVGTLLMAFMSNYPFVLAPGMGLNAFLTFGVVLGMGYSWQFALLAVFVEGIVFLALSLTPVREGIFNSIPLTLKRAVAAGIGLFICFIALQTAKIIVNEYPEAEIRRILFEYGEERFSSRIASNIIKAREKAPIETTGELVEIIKRSLPAASKDGGHHPAKRSFQALRIEVNAELDVIAPAIRSAVSLLRPGGRIAIITFHSLEDRIVKQCFAELSSGCTCPRDFPVCVCGKKPTVRLVNRKPILPSPEELEENPRSRSAKLRVAEKL